MLHKNKPIGMDTQGDFICLVEDAVELQLKIKENFGITLLISECIRLIQTQFLNKQLRDINDEMVILLQLMHDDIDNN